MCTVSARIGVREDREVEGVWWVGAGVVFVGEEGREALGELGIMVAGCIVEIRFLMNVTGVCALPFLLVVMGGFL